jgi:hypothetical protein
MGRSGHCASDFGREILREMLITKYYSGDQVEKNEMGV